MNMLSTLVLVIVCALSFFNNNLSLLVFNVLFNLLFNTISFLNLYLALMLFLFWF